MEAWLNSLMATLSLPEYGLSTVFVVSFISATLLPMGSEPAVFGLVKLNPELLWPAIGVATVGNTLGGALDWWKKFRDATKPVFEELSIVSDKVFFSISVKVILFSLFIVILYNIYE